MVNGYTLVPVSLQKLIANHSIRLDWDYVKSNKVWKLHSCQVFDFTYWSQESVNALRVINKLEP